MAEKEKKPSGPSTGTILKWVLQGTLLVGLAGGIYAVQSCQDTTEEKIEKKDKKKNPVPDVTDKFIKELRANPLDTATKAKNITREWRDQKSPKTDLTELHSILDDVIEALKLAENEKDFVKKADFLKEAHAYSTEIWNIEFLHKEESAHNLRTFLAQIGMGIQEQQSKFRSGQQFIGQEDGKNGSVMVMLINPERAVVKYQVKGGPLTMQDVPLEDGKFNNVAVSFPDKKNPRLSVMLTPEMEALDAAAHIKRKVQYWLEQDRTRRLEDLFSPPPEMKLDVKDVRGDRKPRRERDDR